LTARERSLCSSANLNSEMTRRATNGTRFDAASAKIRARLHRPAWPSTFLLPPRWLQKDSIARPAMVARLYGRLRNGAGRAAGADRQRTTKPGTVRALAVIYFNSPEFRSLRPSSQAIYRGIIDRFCIQYGDNRIANLKREHVVKLMAVRAERPVA